MQMVEAQTADLAGAVLDCHDQSLVALQLRHQVDRRVLPPIDLALLQGRRRGAGVGQEIPHDPVEIDNLGPGVEAWLAVLARHVIRVFLEQGALASSARAISAVPIGSRWPQRLIVAAQSRANTGLPSWNLSPSRRVRSHCLPSFETVSPATICGCTAKSASKA